MECPNMRNHNIGNYHTYLKLANGNRLKEKALSYFGLNNRYKRYINSFSDSYRKACIKGNKVIVLCNEYITPFAEKVPLNEI